MQSIFLMFRRRPVIDGTFRKTLRYQSKDEPASLVADLDELGRRSRAAKIQRRIGFAWLIGGAVAGIVGTVLGHSVPWYVCGGVLTAVSVVLAVVFIERVSRWIIDDRRCKLAALVVRALGCDLPPTGKLDLMIDFNEYHDQQFRTGTSTLPRYAASEYRHPWLAVTGTLADGSRLSLASDLVARRKERTKTKGRKKIKEDLCEHVVLTLRVPTLPPVAPHRWPDLVRARPMPPGAYVHRAGVKENRLTLEVRTQRHIRVTNKGTVEAGRDVEEKLRSRHTLLVPVLAAYHALHACR